MIHSQTPTSFCLGARFPPAVLLILNAVFIVFDTIFISFTHDVGPLFRGGSAEPCVASKYQDSVQNNTQNDGFRTQNGGGFHSCER